MSEKVDPGDLDQLRKVISKLQSEAQEAWRRGRVLVIETREEVKSRNLYEEMLLYPAEIQ